MNPATARRLLANGVDGPGRHVLTVWAHARAGRTIDPRIFDALPATTQRRDHSLLDGLILATLIDEQGDSLKNVTVACLFNPLRRLAPRGERSRNTRNGSLPPRPAP